MSMRIFFIQRGTTINEAIEDMRKQGWHKILPIGESPLPQEGKIKIRVKDVKYHPIKEDGTPIPESKEEFRTFEIAEQVGNSETGDIDIYAYALPDE